MTRVAGRGKNSDALAISKWTALWDLYTNPDVPGSLNGVEQLYAAAVRKKFGGGGRITRADVRNFLSSTDVYALHKPARKRFPRARIIVWGLNYLWQIDLAQLSSLSRFNKGYKFILVAVDGFSSRAMFEPLHRKTGPLTSEAME